MTEPITADKKTPVSVIILTFNEEANIIPCLGSLAWADEIIVVDSFSNDATLDLAKQARPDVHILRNKFEDFGQQRNWALDNTHPKHEWILFVDADERHTPGSAEAVAEAIRNPGPNVGFYLTYRNFFLGKWIKHCSLYPSWQLRLLKKGYVRYEKEGHGQREVTEGPLGYIKESYDHFGFSKGIHDWIARHNNYSSHEAERILSMRKEPLKLFDLLNADSVKRRRCLKRIATRVPCRSLVLFLWQYIFRCGFLDGRAGWIYCGLLFTHRLHISFKLEEKSSKHIQDV